MKIISVGTNHAGTSFLRTIKTLDPSVEVTTYDRNTNISFLGCGIALWVGGEFDDPSGLFYSDKEALEKMGIDVHMEHDVVEINSKEKFVVVKNLKTGETFKDTFDKLVFAGGTWPIVPPFPGVDSKNIFLSKLYQHAQVIKEKTNDKNVKDVVVVGAGYIGIELVEAFAKAGKNVTLIDMADRVVPRYFDKEFTQPMQDRMTKDGVTLKMGEKITTFEANDKGEVTTVNTDKGSYKADMVILSIGFKPQTQMLENQVDMLPSKAIIVDEFMRSSNKDVYAIGDAAAIKHNVLGQAHVALATNAVKTGIVAAFDILGKSIEFPGVQGTNAINVFDCKYASTGISEESAKALKIEAKSEFFTDKDRPEFMHNAEDVQIKITYNPTTLKLLGAQIGSFGNENHTEAIFALSLAIQKGLTLPELALMDVYFLPHFNKPFNYILKVILNALGLVYK